MGRCRRDKVHLTVAQRENFEQISAIADLVGCVNEM